MGGPIDMMAFYTSRSLDSVIGDTIATYEQAGFETDPDNKRVESGYHIIEISYDSLQFRIQFNLDEDQSPSEPVLSIGCGHKIKPAYSDDKAEYLDIMSSIFGLLCRLSATLDVDYAPLFTPEDRYAYREGRPFAEAIEELPRMGVYSAAVIDQFGGLDAMFDSPPWYTATLEDGKTVVVETEMPWLKGGWQPPTDADYRKKATFSDSDEQVQAERRGLADPFAALKIGEIRTDLCVPREKIDSVFRNEDLQLVRVCVDENRDLRRINNNTFVRNIVDDDPGDDAAFLIEMLADIPADAAADDLMVSALLQAAISPELVRLDDPDDENIIPKVMALDTDDLDQYLRDRLY